MKQQQELFDGFVRLRHCRRCNRKLHLDPQNRYRTREAGLCYACLREFEVSPFWTVDKFIEESKKNEPAQKRLQSHQWKLSRDQN